MLSLLVERVLEGKPLTTNRADLMADLAERRLCRELTDGRHPAHLLRDPKTTLGAADVALSRLGYAMQTDRGLTVLDETSAQAAVKDAQPSRLSVQEVFALVVGSGLLEQKRAEDGRLSYVFYHHLLQEYFAGRELLRRFKAGEDLSEHWKVSWQAPHPLLQRLRRTQQSKYVPPPPVTGWEETTRMAAAQAGVHLEKLVKAVARWNLPLAGRCLADAGSLDNPQCDNFRIELLKRQRNPRAQLPARIDAGLALGDLGHSELKARPFLFEGQTVYAVRPPMQTIPAGVFLLGSDPNDQEAHPDEITSQRTVDLPAFSMGRYPVTNGEYRWFIEAGGYNCQLWWSPEGWEWRCGGPEAHAGPIEDWLAYRSWLMQGENLKKQAQRFLWSESNTAFWREMTALSFEEAKAKARRIFSRPFDRPAYWDDPRLNAALLPVVGVNWHEACAYAGWLSAVTGTPYALPPETHWEKAARGTNGRIYPWDGPFNSSRCNTVESGIRQPTPVGLFPNGASPFGLMDAAGCVWEWSESYYQAYPGGDPQASDDFGEKYRVLRGGSWGSTHRLARCACRSRYVPDNFYLNTGFRLFSPGLFLDSDS